MLNRFFKVHFRKRLFIVLLFSFLWLSIGRLGNFLEISQTSDLVYAGDNSNQSLDFMLAQAEAVINLLEQEGAVLKEQLRQSQDALSKAETKLNNRFLALTQPQQETQRKLADQEAKINLQKKEISTLKAQLRNLEKTLSDSQSQLKAELARLKAEKLNLEKELSTLGEYKADGESKLKSELDTLKQNKISLQAQLEQVTNDLKVAETRLSDQLAQATKYQEEAGARITLLEKEKCDFREQIGILENDKSASENKLKVNLESLKQEGTLLKQAAEEKDNLILFFNKQISALEKAKLDSESRLNTDLAQLKKQNKANEEKLWAKIAGMTITEANLKSEIEILTKAKKELEERMIVLQKEETALQAGYEEQLTVLNTRINALHDRNAQTQAELQAEIEVLKGSLRQAEQARVEAEDLLKNEIAVGTEKENKIKELQDRIAVLEKVAPVYLEQINYLDKDRQLAELRVATLMQSQEMQEAKCDEKLATLEDQNNELETIKEELRSLEIDQVRREQERQDQAVESEPTLQLKDANAVEVPQEQPVLAETKLALAENQTALAAAVIGSVIEKDTLNNEILVDLVESDGLTPGQRLQVLREDKQIAELRVERVADSFTVTKAVSENDFQAVELFDKVRLSL